MYDKPVDASAFTESDGRTAMEVASCTVDHSCPEVGGSGENTQQYSMPSDACMPGKSTDAKDYNELAKLLISFLQNGGEIDDLETSKNALNRVFVLPEECSASHVTFLLKFLSYNTALSPELSTLGLQAESALLREKIGGLEGTVKELLLTQEALKDANAQLIDENGAYRNKIGWTWTGECTYTNAELDAEYIRLKELSNKMRTNLTSAWFEMIETKIRDVGEARDDNGTSASLP